MTRVIDDKVVAMSFENSKFESGVHESLSSLDKLKNALKFPNAGKGLEDINASSKKVDLSHISRGIEEVSSRLNAFRLIAIGVFAEVAHTAITTGTRFAKAFTLDPIKAGFKEYATNLNAVQTILANTQAAGVGIKDVNATLDELNEFSDKTIYNFGQMARNIGTFTAAGVDLKTATASIKGIADLAALSGSSADQAATAMYQLSQAISAGRVGLQDWNSVVNAGMGGTVFQRALAQTAEAMGTLEKGTLKLVGPMKNVSINGQSFRQSMQAGPGKTSWLTSKVLTETLKQFTGDLTDAELAAKGFNQEQIKAIQQTAKTAMHAATEVKTIAQVIDVAKETAGSGWANTWRIVFGDFAEAKKTFTELSNAINGFINTSADARNAVLEDWKKLGGRTELIKGIKNVFHALGEILGPIKDAFRSFFPAKTGKELFEFTKRFTELTERMKPSTETLVNLRRIFAGVFAVVDIGREIISQAISLFARLFHTTGAGGGGFLALAANIGDSLVAVHDWLVQGGKLSKFFDTLGDILAVPIKLFGLIRDAVGDLFGGFSAGGVTDQTNKLTGALGPLHDILDAVADIWDRLIESMGGASGIFQTFLDVVVEVIQGIAPALGDAAANMNFEAVLSVIRTGLFAALVLMFKNFLGPGSALQQLTGRNSILGSLRGSFAALRGSLVSMQTNVKADTLRKIAIAVALLAASVVALSLVDPERLKSSLTAMAVAFGQLLGAMAILETIGTGKGFLRMPFITASMIAMAAAIDLLTIAVLVLSKLSWEELAKGLGGIAAILVVVSGAMIPLSANSAGMIRAGIGISAVAVALNILALAVRQFASMNMVELSKGLGSIAVGLTIMVKAMSKMPFAGMVRAGVGIIAISTGLRILAEAVSKFATLNMRELAKGLGAVAISLGIIAGAMKIMPKNILRQSAALILIAGALNLIAKAVTSMGQMSIKEIAKGLGTLAGSLIILGVALKVMSTNIAGAVSLGIVAAGIALLVPALVALGKQSWESIIKSMVALAAALTILGIAGLVLAPVTPALLGLGAALLLIGGGLALAGAGIFLFATGFSALVVAFPTGVGVMVAAMKEFTAGIIENVKNLILGLLEIVQALAKVAPKFVNALVKILGALLDVIIKSAPKIAEAFSALMQAAIDIIEDNSPKIIALGIQLLLDFLKGIRKNISKIIVVATDIIANFLNTIANNIGKIVTAGTNILIKFVEGIGKNITRVVTVVGEIIVQFIKAVVGKWADIISAGAGVLAKFLEGLGKNLRDVITAGAKLIAKVVEGIGQGAKDVTTAAVNVATSFVRHLSREIVRLSNDVATAIIALINGLADVIERRAPEFRGALVHLGWAIIDGMTLGLGQRAHKLYDKAKEIGQKALNILKKPWKWNSPSKVMIDLGEGIIEGWVIGLDKNSKNIYNSASALSNGFLKIVTDIFQIRSPSKTMIELGKSITQGFAQGIRGNPEEIKQAFVDMTEGLTTAVKDLREEYEAENKELIRLQNLKPSAENTAEIAKQIKVVYGLIDAHGAARKARNLWLNGFKDERLELLNLSKAYQKVSDKLLDAQDKLDTLKKERVDAIAGFAAQYAALPDVTPDEETTDPLGIYKDALVTQTNAIKLYSETLQQLRGLGLDNETYNKLLAEGPEAQAFATQLLSGGKTAVDSLNALDKQLAAVSQTLATNAGNNLYNAGIKAKQSLVDGLKADKTKLRLAMEEIAREMVTALKRELKMKSPSQVFVEIGELSMQGLAKGFTQSSKIVTEAVKSASKDAISSMKKTISDMSDVVSNELNPNPVITPILDLTQIRRQAEEMSSITDISPLTPNASLNQAALISTAERNAITDQASEAQAPSVITYEQNNYSPESLSAVEIYRQTRNQLSILKTQLVPT